jgi:hypothetical protein
MAVAEGSQRSSRASRPGRKLEAGMGFLGCRMENAEVSIDKLLER